MKRKLQRKEAEAERAANPPPELYRGSEGGADAPQAWQQQQHHVGPLDGQPQQETLGSSMRRYLVLGFGFSIGMMLASVLVRAVIGAEGGGTAAGGAIGADAVAQAAADTWTYVAGGEAVDTAVGTSPAGPTTTAATAGEGKLH
jgi:hypothetical protein